MDQKKIGTFIAELRKGKNLTQEQLGERLGVSQRTVSRWETGKNMPDISLLSRLCEILGISLAELLKGERIAGQIITTEEASGILSSVIDLWKDKNRIKRLAGAFLAGFITLVCMVALYNYEFSINIVSTADLEEAINVYHFAEPVDADVLERQAIGNRLIVLYAQNEYPACGGIAQLEKGIFGKYRMISTNNFTWPLYNTMVVTVDSSRYLLVCGVNELSEVARYEIDLIAANGKVNIHKGVGEADSFIHLTKIEDGQTPAPWTMHYFDAEGREIEEASLCAGLKEDRVGLSNSVSSMEGWLIYVLECVVFIFGMVFVRYFMERN